MRNENTAALGYKLKAAVSLLYKQKNRKFLLRGGKKLFVFLHLL